MTRTGLENIRASADRLKKLERKMHELRAGLICGSPPITDMPVAHNNGDAMADRLAEIDCIERSYREECDSLVHEVRLAVEQIRMLEVPVHREVLDMYYIEHAKSWFAVADSIDYSLSHTMAIVRKALDAFDAKDNTQ